MDIVITPLIHEQIIKRFDKLKPFEQVVFKKIAALQQSTHQTPDFCVNLSFEDFKSTNAIPIPDEMAASLLVKTLESLLFSRGYYTTAARLTIEYNFLSGYRIMSDYSASIYVEPFLTKVVCNAEY